MSRLWRRGCTVLRTVVEFELRESAYQVPEGSRQHVSLIPHEARSIILTKRALGAKGGLSMA